MKTLQNENCSPCPIITHHLAIDLGYCCLTCFRSIWIVNSAALLGYKREGRFLLSGPAVFLVAYGFLADVKEAMLNAKNVPDWSSRLAYSLGLYHQSPLSSIAFCCLKENEGGRNELTCFNAAAGVANEVFGVTHLRFVLS
eukprot:scaffold7949_cov37-Cyclotella_meneghiniana.AAC.7